MKDNTQLRKQLLEIVQRMHLMPSQNAIEQGAMTLKQIDERNVNKLLSLIESEKEQEYKRGFTDCQRMAKSGKYPELSITKKK